MRIHVATFDAADNGPDYNFEDCNIAADLFGQQPGLLTRFWCERAKTFRRSTPPIRAAVGAAGEAIAGDAATGVLLADAARSDRGAPGR
jgi:hypothetical protein